MMTTSHRLAIGPGDSPNSSMASNYIRKARYNVRSISYFAGLFFGKKDVSCRQITMDKVLMVKEGDGPSNLLAEVEQFQCQWLLGCPAHTMHGQSNIHYIWKVYTRVI